MKKMINSKAASLSILLVFLLVIAAACSPAVTSPSAQAEPTAVAEVEQAHDEMDGHEDESDHEHDAEHDHEHDADMTQLDLPDLQAVALNGRPLRVVATTSIIGDVVAQVAGDAVELTTLMGPGQDPHSYQPAAADLTAVARADAVFVNGWDLEEGLLDDLANIGEGAPLVPVSAGIAPLAFGEHAHEDEHAPEEEQAGEGEHHHSGADPHTWLSVHSVMKWVENVAATLSALDPANAATYSANAEAYLAELKALDEYAHTQLATIPEEKRVLVTNHEAFGYFADAYEFEVLGTVIPGVSTVSEPSASDLATLIQAMQDEGVCAIFTETTVSDRLGNTVAAELTGCEDVQVVKLFTGALGPAGSGADSYVDMFRSNVDAIVSALSGG